MTIPLHNARLIPPDVNQLLLLGGWLFGSAANPNRDYRSDMPKDFDICVEPPEAAAVRALLVSWTPLRHTKFGGTVYQSMHGTHTIDVWFSTIGETFRAILPGGQMFAANIRYGRSVTYTLN
jgi:hypothetical protein